MNHTQISVAIRNPDKIHSSLSDFSPPYLFLFRTDWMEPSLADIALQQLIERFPKPNFQITLCSRHTNTTMQDL